MKKCNNLLVKLNNHRVNAAEQAIQTFKVHFISALATTDSKFLLHLWERLTPKSRQPSTCYTHHDLIPQCRHMKLSMVHTTGTVFPYCPSRLQGCDIQSPHIARILGQQGHQCMVRWAIDEPLPLQPFLHP
jgi:hypothetical protein